MRYQYLFFFILFTTVSKMICKKSNIRIFGERMKHDSLIFKTQVCIRAKMFPRSWELYEFNGDNYNRITQIKIIVGTKGRAARNARIRVCRGGYGHKYIVICFMRKRFKNINYIIEIYGKPKWKR
jgi:hypothetical protein